MQCKKRHYRKENYRAVKASYDEWLKSYSLELDTLDGEAWHDITGYEGVYQISNFGRVKSFYNGKIIIRKPSVDAGGYLNIALWQNGKSTRHFIHRLVAESFLPKITGKLEVNHKDGCKFNLKVREFPRLCRRWDESRFLLTLFL